LIDLFVLFVCQSPLQSCLGINRAMSGSAFGGGNPDPYYGMETRGLYNEIMTVLKGTHLTQQYEEAVQT
jgi:hypothetical protein